MQHNYYVYITTNSDKEVLYTGVTNNLLRRIIEHQENRGEKRTFAGRYFSNKLVYYEHFTDIVAAIAREKQIKGWRREKKIALIESMNPDWNFYDPYNFA
jgi:putative endonuclease